MPENPLSYSLGSDRIVILGLQGYGKTTLVKHLIQGARHIVLDPLHEYTDENAFTEKPDMFVQRLWKFGRGIVVCEEASMYLRRGIITPAWRDYFDAHRHMGQTPIIVARRPTQLDPDVIELATKIILFNLPGANDRAMLESIAPSLGDQVRELRKYEYLWVDEGRRIYVKPFI